MASGKILGKKEANALVEKLASHYRDAHYYLNFKTPIDLLVAAILSAQTRDQVTNSVTPSLFAKYRTAKDYANSDEDALIDMIKSVSFAGNKARSIIRACGIINERYKGKVPDKMDELLELPGIGRKTANTILINAYGVVEGIPVDTWVIKLSPRLGLSMNKNPDKIENDLKGTLDRKYWGKITYILKNHGRAVCQAVPQCSVCPVNNICPKNNVAKRI